MDSAASVHPQPGTPDGDAILLAAIGTGDESAFGRLYDAWFDRSYDVALRIVRDDAAAADIAQDALLAAWRNIDDLQDQHAFGGWLLRITRNRALDHKRKHDRSIAVDDETMAVIEATDGGPEARLVASTDPARAVEDAEIVRLVWEAADALGDRDASLLDLHLRHGLAPAEIADELGVEPNAAHQSLHRMRERLGAAIAARVLWHGGTPTCEVLTNVLHAAGSSAFDGDTAAQIRRHAKRCGECTERQQSRLEPSKLFAAVPVAVAPLALKAKAAAAMEAAGVPMEGSASTSTTETTTDGSSPSTARSRRLLTGALVALVVLAATVAALLAFTVKPIGNRTQEATSTTSVTERATSTTTAVDSTTTDGGVTGSTPRTEPGDPATPDPARPGPDPATPAAPPLPGPRSPTSPTIISFRLDRTTIPTETAAPTIAWVVDPAGSGTAELTGPDFLATSLSGSQTVCPGDIVSGVCVTAPGSYDYTLHAYDSAGDQVDVRTLTLVVG